jgi:hypothetical protein
MRLGGAPGGDQVLGARDDLRDAMGGEGRLDQVDQLLGRERFRWWMPRATISTRPTSPLSANAIPRIVGSALPWAPRSGAT